VASDWEGVAIAPNDTLLTASPDWERIDYGVSGLRVKNITVRSGRQSEFEQTNTGTMEIQFADREGVLDPTNTGSPYYGKLISRPFALALRDPIRDEWFPVFRGCIEEAGYGITKHQLHEDTAIVAVDALDYFANFELIAGLAGFSNAQLNAQGYVFYEDAGFDERLLALLADVNWPLGLSSVFTGNIICAESVYSNGDKALQVIQEACDAEFPTVANYYIDRAGLLQIHGRYARFDPVGVSADASNWTFRGWKAGDNAAAQADSGLGGTAKMQEPYSGNVTRAMIRNAALAYPQDVDQSDLSQYLYTDESSRDEHGTKTWTAPNLKVAEETTIGLTAKEICKLFSQYIVENYKDEIPRISDLTIGSEHPTHGVYGPASWEMICEANISDTVDVTIAHPGGGGFTDERFYIEGISMDIRPGQLHLHNGFPIVKAKFDLSSANHWANSPFGGFS